MVEFGVGWSKVSCKVVGLSGVVVVVVVLVVVGLVWF